MAKQKKRRNKKYTGEDAAVTKKTVTRISAQEKSKAREYYDDNRQTLMVRGVFIGLIIVLVIIFYLIAQFIF